MVHKSLLSILDNKMNTALFILYLIAVFNLKAYKTQDIRFWNGFCVIIQVLTFVCGIYSMAISMGVIEDQRSPSSYAFSE